ncbi:DMT family transporter [Phytoactinopolyspora halotolerans]|uniref:DMT family transporter n=1 Tax=Phytoactinopolyspora halotolerans TaxID=1981512 RepID=A0A6L9SDZ0_9ACTN|nr:DMT family transporter [Phytoactinopolyspora halotolerans]NEE03486.1 hypothetical protein [Phytoactinopolyspora halotolerans]
MSAVVVAILLSIAAAQTHAVTAVVQERLASRVGGARLLRRRRWWIAVGLAVVASLLRVGALRYGPLTVVQPLSALSLALALPLRAMLVRHRVSAAEWHGAGLTVVGMAGLLLLTASGEPARTLSDLQVTILSVGTFVVLAALLTAAFAATARPVSRSLLHAVGAGVAFGVGSAIAQTVVVETARQGAGALVSPATAVVFVLAGGAMYLAQLAYQAGLAAPLATLTLINPVIAGVIGVTLLGEQYSAGPVGTTLAVVAGAVAARGIMVLTMAGSRNGGRIMIEPEAEAAVR